MYIHINIFAYRHRKLPQQARDRSGNPPMSICKTLAVLVGQTQIMRITGHILLLGLFSIIVQTIVQFALARLTSFEYLQETQHLFIISTMLAFLVLTYFILRRWNNKSRPSFMKALTTMLFIQVLTIISLTTINIASVFFSTVSTFLPDTTAIAIQFDATDFIIKTLIFALGLPLIILTVTYLLDRKKINNYG